MPKSKVNSSSGKSSSHSKNHKLKSSTTTKSSKNKSRSVVKSTHASKSESKIAQSSRDPKLQSSLDELPRKKHATSKSDTKRIKTREEQNDIESRGTRSKAPQQDVGQPSIEYSAAWPRRVNKTKIDTSKYRRRTAHRSNKNDTVKPRKQKTDYADTSTCDHHKEVDDCTSQKIDSKIRKQKIDKVSTE